MSDDNNATTTDDGTAGAQTEQQEQQQQQRTFTQSELNAILADRLARDRAKFADYDDLKTKAQQFEELQAKQMSDLERAQQAAQQAADRAARAEDTLRGERLRSAVISEAVKAGAVDPDAVFALVDRTSLLTEQGEPTGVQDAITALLETKPYLKAQPTKPGGDIGAGRRGTQQTGEGTFTRSQLRDTKFFAANRAAIEKAMAEGKIVED
jgi:hypothetical protein